MKGCLLPLALLSLCAVLCSGQLEDTDFCTYSELRRPILNMTCPKVPYQNVVGEAEGIIAYGSAKFDGFLSQLQGSSSLDIQTGSSSVIIAQVLHGPLTSLASNLQRYERNAKLQVLLAWTDQQSSDVSIPLFYEGRAAMLSATGVSTAELFSWAVYSDFGWVWYAGEDHIIVAVRGSCSLVADIGVWIDSSGSISRGDFDDAKDVVHGIVTRFGVSEPSTHFSLGSFSDEVSYSQLDDSYDVSTVLDTLEDLNRLGGYTYTDLALETWGSKVFTEAGGARPGVVKIGMIFTDGKASRPFEHHLPTLENLGVTIFAIPINSQWSRQGLEALASTPTGLHVLTSWGIHSVDYLVDTLLSGRFCKASAFLTGNRGVSGEGGEGDVRYYDLQCPFIGQGVTVELETLEGDTAVYASASVRNPGLFTAPAAVVSSVDAGYQRVRRLTVPVQQGSQNLYVSVGCRAAVNRFQIVAWEDLFDGVDGNVTVDGDAPGNTLVTTIRSPYISDYTDYTFSIGAGNGEDQFFINSQTGQLTTTRAFNIDQTSFTLVVTMASRVLTCRQSPITLQITVIHTSNRFAPTLSNPHQHFLVSEHAPVGHLVHHFQYYDPDQDSFSVTFLSGNVEGAFNISNIGELTVAKQLNASVLSQYNFEMQAVDNGQPMLSSRYAFTVMLIDEDDPPRFIELCAQQGSCICESVEQATRNSFICRSLVLGFDFDIRSEYRQIYYQIVVDTLPISIDSSGQLFLTGTVDRDLLPFDEFEGEVSISNSQHFTSSSSCRITFRILDLNDNHPQFETAFYHFDLSEDAAVRTVLGEVRAVDPDAGENGVVTYSIRSTEDVPFVVTSSGEIILSGNVSREDIPSYRFEILAVDSGAERLSGSTEVFVTLVDVNDNAPIFSPEEYVATVPESALRGTPVITATTLSVSDADIGVNAQILFSIAGGSSVPFSIDETMGYISVSDTLDAEFQRSYTVQVIARDQGVPSRSAYASISITVSDVNDEDPIFVNPFYYFYISEDASPGEVLGQLEAYDQDVTQHTVAYSLPDQSNLPFSLNQTTGTLNLATRLDYENASLYHFVALAEDSGPPSSRSATVRVRVEVQDVADTVPTVESGTRNISIPESISVGQAIVEIASSDRDAAYRIDAGNTNGAFSINSTTGSLLTAKQLDYEAVSEYTLAVAVYNRQNVLLSSTVSVVVTVTDVNDNSPVLMGVPQQLNLPENTVPFTILFTAEATDVDSALWTNFQFALHVSTSGTCSQGVFAQDLFVLNQNGSVTVGGAGVTVGRGCIYRLTVGVLDNGNNSQSRISTTQCEVYVYDINDNPPIFQANDPLTVNITEGTRSPFEVVTVTADDADSGTNSEVEHHIGECQGVIWCQVEDYTANRSGCSNTPLSPCPFAVDLSTGIVLFVGEVDHETVSLYSVTVVASDNGIPPLSTTLTLLVNVLDTNDSPPQISPKRVQLSLPEGTPPGTIITEFNVSDSDSFGDITRLNYSLISQPFALSVLLTMTPNRVMLVLQDSLDFEQSQEVFLTISVCDGTFTDEARIHLAIINTNDNDPVFLSPAYNFSVSESAALGELVGMVEATDVDGPEFGPLVYTLIGSNTSFAVNGSSGEIRVSSTLDYETTQQHTFQAIVADSTNEQDAYSAAVTVTVYVENDDDNPPTVTAPHSVTVRDTNSTSVITFTATDVDQPNEAPSVTFELEQVTLASRTNTTSTYTLVVGYADNIYPRATFVLTVVLEYVCEIVRFSLNALNAELSMSTLCSVTLSAPSTLALGSNATITCEASANVPTVYYWYKDGSPIAGTLSTGELTLNNVGYERSGDYSCAAVNSAGRLTTGTVQEVVIHGPPVVIPPDSQTAATGVEVSFSCIVQSNLNYTVEWTLNGAPLMFTPNIESVGDTLTIRSVLGNHEGDYRCVVSNAAGTTTSEPASLTVCDCKEPFTRNFTFEIPRSSDSNVRTVGSVASPYQVYFNYHYAIVAGNDDSVFAIDRNEGLITIIQSIAATTRQQYMLMVYAEDGTQVYTGYTSVLITVIDVNSYSPVFDAPNSVEVPETHFLNSPVLRFFVRDPDQGSSGQVTVFINETQDYAAFRLDHDADDAYSLYATVAFNASQRDYYNLLLVAQDHGTSPRLVELRLTIEVQDVNEPPVFIPPCAALGQCSASFAEDTSPGHIVAVMNAYDTDTGVLSDLSYSFTTDVPFSIDGNGTVTLSQTIDFDTVSVSAIVLGVVVRDGGGLSSISTLVLSVTDVNDITPQFSSPSFTITIKESIALNSHLRLFVAQDGDEGERGQILYSLENSTFFEINLSTGELTLTGSLDYESQYLHIFNIVATDQGVPPLSSFASVTVIVENVNDVAPRFVSVPSECLEVEESRSVGAEVLRLSVEDADSVRFSYGIVSGQDRNNPAFFMEESTGVLSVYSDLDAETQDHYQLVLSVSDVVSSDSGGFILSDTASLCIRVTDVNEYAPNFDEDHYNFSLPTGAQPGYFVGSVQATDRDHAIEIGAASLTYAIRSGNELDVFSVDNSSGVLTLTSAVNSFSSFQLTVVVVDDGGNEDLVDVLVWILDSSTEIPLFSTGNVTVYLSENSGDHVIIARLDEQFVTSYFGTTVEIVSLSVSPSTVTVTFDDRDGTLAIASTVDREVVGTISIVAVTSIEGSPITPLVCTIAVAICDVNDNPPQFVPAGPFNVDVNEDAAPGTEVIAIQASDDDSGINSEVEYSMAATSIICRDLFALNDTTGSVHIVSALSLQSVTECNFVISASDNGNPKFTVNSRLLVTIQDVNDNAPTFTRPSYEFDVSESDGGAFIVFAYVVATDEDSGVNSAIQYSIKPSSVGAYKGGVQVSTTISLVIDAASGALSATRQFDYETEEVLLFTAVATDGGNPAQSSEVNVTIRVTDYNDNAPQLETNHYVTTVNESVPSSTTLFEVVATDRDGPANRPLVYSLTVHPVSSPITIDAETGRIYTLASLDYEVLPVITGSILVTDGRWTATAALTLHIENENDNRPVFPTDCSSIVREDAELGVTLFTCAAADLDFGTFGQLRFAIISGNSDGVFTFTPFSAEMYLNKPLDYERKVFYALTLTATDGGGLVSTVNATVTVQNVDDSPPVLVGPREFSLTDILYDRPILLANLTVEDEDLQEQTPVVTFSLGSNTTSDIFRQTFGVELVVADGSGMSSNAVVLASFQQACYFAEFRLRRVDLQDYLELWTLCTLSVGLSSDPALNGAVTLLAIAVGAIPVQQYCWYRNSLLLTCTTDSYLDLVDLTLAHEGSYYADAHTALGVIQSASVGLTIEVPPSITCAPTKAVEFQDSATLNCWIYNPKGVPLQLTWTFEGQVLPLLEGTGAVQEGSVYYFIDSATFDRQGTYTCEVVGTLGGQEENRSEDSVVLSVYRGTSLISLDVEVFNYSYEHQCQLFDIYTFLNDVASAYMEGTSPNVLTYTSNNLCEPGPCFPNPCQSSGICHNMGNSSVCECLPGWGGEQCDSPVDPCATNPCLFGGTCITSGVQSESFVCLCPSGRAGKSCELIEHICSGQQCQSGTFCLPSEFSTQGFVCVSGAPFRLTVNVPYFTSARGHTPEGGLFVSNSSSSLTDYHLSIFDTEVVIRSLISSEMHILSNLTRTVLQLCVPRVVSAGGGVVDMVLNCPRQATVPIEMHSDICHVLLRSGLFTACTTPGGVVVMNSTDTGRVQCEFYMHDEEGESIPVEDILSIIQIQTVVYLNSTEYRVLGVERANNGTITTPIKTPAGGFPVWAGVLLALLLSVAIAAVCVTVACCIYCTKRRKKIVEKQFIVQRSGPSKESSVAWNPYTIEDTDSRGDWMFDMPAGSNPRAQQGAGEFVDDEEFYTNPSAWNVYDIEDRNVSESALSRSAASQEFEMLGSSSNSQAPLLQSFASMNNTERYIDVFKDVERQRVTVRNPMNVAAKPQATAESGSEEQLRSESKYQSMHEDNPLYAAMEDLLKEETVVSIEREVVIETVGQDSNVADLEFTASKTVQVEYNVVTTSSTQESANALAADRHL